MHSFYVETMCTLTDNLTGEILLTIYPCAWLLVHSVKLLNNAHVCCFALSSHTP